MLAELDHGLQSHSARSTLIFVCSQYILGMVISLTDKPFCPIGFVNDKVVFWPLTNLLLAFPFCSWALLLRLVEHGWSMAEEEGNYCWDLWAAKHCHQGPRMQTDPLWLSLRAAELASSDTTSASLLFFFLINLFSPIILLLACYGLYFLFSFLVRTWAKKTKPNPIFP